MWKRFRYWLVNVFWYHYRFHALACIGAVFILVVLVRDIQNRKNPDLTYAILSDDLYVDYSTGDTFAPFFHPVLQDIQDDGVIDSYCDALWLSDYNENLYVVVQKMTVVFLDEQYSLFIITESSLGRVLGQQDMGNIMLDLAALGYPTHQNASWLADVSDSRVWRELGFDGDERFYAAIRRTPEKADTALRAARENALRCLDLLTKDEAP